MAPSMLPDLRQMAGPHVFVDDLAAPHLRDADRHHLERALRLRAGDPLTMSDAAGSWRAARFGPTLEVSGETHYVDEPPYPVSVAVALTKGSKPEFVVQKATELGVNEIVVFESEHSVVTWDAARRDKAQDRLERVAREAAMQSRQVRLPTILIASGLASVLATGEWVRADFGGGPVAAEHHRIAIGPEGGWSPAERAELPHAVDLGPSVLRAETAALVAAAQLVGQRTAHDG